ncbi:hypothetical protein SLA2020_042410 [Shorea laevis]
MQLLSLRQLRSFRGVTLYYTKLEIVTSFRKWELPGIFYMLKACPVLKELVILSAIRNDKIEVPQDFMMQHDFQEYTYLRSQLISFKGKLKCLETVRFMIRDGEYQTWEEGFFELYYFFNGSRIGPELAAFLRLTAPNLKRMIFETWEQHHEVCFQANN